MGRINDEELKSIELDILKDVHTFCEMNNLTYYLCGGTLLGAVRHRGFIPWDDDIDIFMPRLDYERFLTEYASKQYSVLCHKNTQGYYLPFAKVIDKNTRIEETLVKSIPNCGVFVDVFPIDGFSDDFDIAKKMVKKAKRYMFMNSLSYSLPQKNDSIKHIVKNVLIKFARRNIYLKKIEKLSRRYSFENSKYVGCVFGFYGEREINLAEVFSDRQLLQFEDSEFYAAIGTDEYLTKLYGDYMTPPPIEKQVTHHSFIAYRK